MELPGLVNVLGYSDDSGKTVDEMQTIANKTVEKVRKMIRDKQVELAPEKTEAIVLVGCRGVKELNITVGKLGYKHKRKRLGIVFERNMSRVVHVGHISEKYMNIGKNRIELCQNRECSELLRGGC